MKRVKPLRQPRSADTEDLPDHRPAAQHVNDEIIKDQGSVSVDFDGEANDGLDDKRKRKRKRKPKSSDADEMDQSDKKNDTSSSQSNGYVNEKTIYCEGLPFSATEDSVIKFFKSCGDVASVRLPRWHDSGRLRGYGHVEFTTSEAAQQAFELDGCDFLDTGRYLKIERPQTPRALQVAQRENISRPPGCRTVFVKNLPYEITEEEITKAMQVCGPIAKVRLAVWGHTGQLKGFGYVDFKREDSAEIAGNPFVVF